MERILPSLSVQTLLAFPIIAIVAASLHVLYNIYLHPLKNIPGPKPWAATRVPWCWYQYQGKLQHKLLELHVQYGPAVRIAPNEISFTTDTAWKTIYGQRSQEMRKDPVFSLLTPTGAQSGSFDLGTIKSVVDGVTDILTADRETHIRQRRLLSHAFSERALREQESILQLHVNKLLQQLSSRRDSGPLSVVSWLSFLTFDLIGDMTFGESFDCLDKGEYDPFVAAVQAMATELTFNQMWKYWGLIGLRQYLIPKEATGQRIENIKRAVIAVDKRMQRETAHKDFMHFILTANDEKGMSPAEIHVNAFSLNIAGSESTSTAMCGVLFLSLTHRQTYKRLIQEVRETFQSEEEITILSTINLQYMEAVIAEALRLYPPVAISMPRRTPIGGETIDGIYVPEDMTVGVNPYSAYRFPDNFYRPDEFLPERWLAENQECPPFQRDKRAAFQPFSFGPRNCLGKNLARAEIRLTLAKLFYRFDVELCPGQQDWQAQQKIQGFWQKGPLYCNFKHVKLPEA